MPFVRVLAASVVFRRFELRLPGVAVIGVDAEDVAAPVAGVDLLTVPVGRPRRMFFYCCELVQN